MYYDFNEVSPFIDEDVTGGKIEGTIQMGPFPYKQTFDLCDSLAMVGETCPLKKGSEIITYKDEIPATTPPVSYSLHNVNDGYLKT